MDEAVGKRIRKGLKDKVCGSQRITSIRIPSSGNVYKHYGAETPQYGLEISLSNHGERRLQVHVRIKKLTLKHHPNISKDFNKEKTGFFKYNSYWQKLIISM